MSNEFGPPDGDTILRAQLGGPTVSGDFRVHKLVLSLASSVFRDMFDIPQPTPVVQRADVMVIEVMDPPEALDLVLKLIYPFPPPEVDSLDLLVEGLVIADKYNMEGVRAELRARLTKFMKIDPLRVFAIASRFGFEEEAEEACPLTTVVYLADLTELPDDLKNIPATAYHKLVRLHEKRREEIEDAIDGVLFEPGCGDCKLAKALAEPRMRTKLLRAMCRCEQVKLSGWVRELGVPCKGSCTAGFVEDVVTKLGSNNSAFRYT